MSQSTLTLGRADQGIELSHEEFAKASFDEPWRYERVQGRLAVMSPAGYDHHSHVERICKFLYRYNDKHPGVVEHVFTEAWFRIDEDTDRIPDIGVFLVSKSSSGRLPNRVPELVVEVVSPESGDHRRDYVEKRLDYERAGVKEYVIVDRFEPRVTVLRSVGGRFEEHVLATGEIYATPLLPGLQIPLLAFFDE